MSKFICDLPWIHLSIHPHSVASVCCVADHTQWTSRATTGGVTLSAGVHHPLEIMNSDTYRQIRLEMLRGEVPLACRVCSKIESTGGISKRLKDGVKWGLDHKQITDSDGGISGDLRDVELRLGNYCNLRCRGCNAESSTSWIADYHKLKNVVQLPSAWDHLQRDPSTDYSWCESEAFYAKLLECAPRLSHLHISGGEPFLVPKHTVVLQDLLSRGKSDVTLHYITNLNYRWSTIQEHLHLLKQFAHVEISFSIDDVGERNSYIRKNSDWQLTLDNLKNFTTYYPQWNYSVTQTVMAYNWMTIDDLHTTLNARGLMPRGGIVYNHIHAPHYLSATVLPLQLREQTLARIAGILPARIVQQLHGRYASVENNPQHLEQFIKFTEEVDSVRGENWRTIFPQLSGRLS